VKMVSCFVKSMSKILTISYRTEYAVVQSVVPRFSSNLFQQAKCDRISRETIVDNLDISRSHLTPELGLFLLTSSSPLYHSPVDGHPLLSSYSDPWWSIYWPGGQVLARTILDNPMLARNKTVLDLGSGCGAVTLAAVLSGAKKVIANDIDVNAVMALTVNSELNQMLVGDNIIFSSENLLKQKEVQLLDEVDLILIGDMFYDQDIGESVLEFCSKFKSLDNSKQVFLGDPGRWFLQSSKLVIEKMFVCVAKYDLNQETKMENYGFEHGLVWKMK